MENVLLVVLLLLALSLIGIVLLQRSEGGGLGMGGGGGGGGGLVSARGAATALSKLTWILGIAFLAASLALTVLSARNSADNSVTDLIVAPAEETQGETPATPALPDVTDMMPSTVDDGATDTPVAPPRAE